MTIKVYKDRIEIGAYTLTATPTGASFNGSIAVSKLGSAFRVGQGKSYGFKHGKNASLGPEVPTLIYPNLESIQDNSYKFSFASGAAQNLGSLGFVNVAGATYYSSETHGFSKASFYGSGFTQFPTPGNLPAPSFPYGSFLIRFNCFPTNQLSPAQQDLSEYYTNAAVNNLKRFSFASGDVAEEIGVLSDIYWHYDLKGFFSSINSVSYNSTLHGYHKYNTREYYRSRLTKFSFTNAASRALIFNDATEDMASASSYANIGSQLREPNQRFIGAQLSNNDYGYSVDLSNNPLSSGIGFYSKFPFSSEVQLISIPSGFTNNQYMTGITGPMAGYWHGGLSDAPTILNNTLLVPILPTSGGAQNGNYKFPFATDVLSALTGVPYLGLGHAGTASDTKGHLLNGFISGSSISRERTVYRGPTFLNVPLDSYSAFWETSVATPGLNSPLTSSPDFPANLILTAGFFSNWNRLEYPFASETTIASNPTFNSNNITFDYRIRSHVPSPFGGTSQY